ncbi:coiled-coil domain-containing protein 102A-like [Saccostrea echinata]|uniref:coiled-coil domain-containing protein 102A-like n=1 Tax=Saccostrea echinata TaxID=191078 RepID=UPI002A8123FB|nr:coiled-coil domain-containing protein 102A-like [Saccostrea echinata]
MSQKMKPGSSKGDVSYVRATGASPQLPMAPSPSLMRDGSHTPVSQLSNMDNDWDDRDEIRQRELEEARGRVSQMEKTMRWWSDCTANWREKWSKVRNERNKAREENRQLRAKLEQLVKECTVLKREKQEIQAENVKLKKDSPVGTSDSVKKELENNLCKSAEKEKTFEEKDVNVQTANVNNVSQEVEGSLAEEKVTLFELKLDEAQKTLLAERGDKTSLMKTIEKLQMDLSTMKQKYEEAKRSKQDVLLEISKLKEDHRGEIDQLIKDVDEEISNKSVVDKKLNEVRKELERLQRENADEWGKRERLETEKLALERENKKCRVQIRDLEEQLESKKQQTSAVVDSDMRGLQQDLNDKTKELNDLRHVHAKLKKTFQERQTDLDHSRRRAEQYEMEVKKLRSRIEELKKDLANAEDEADNQANLYRKVQRTNDELQEQIENLQVQLNHTQSRLKRSSQSGINTMSASLRSLDPTDPENNDSDEDDVY